VLVNAHAFPPERLERQVCIDPDDDKFLACAVASGARTIVSGDKHLLSVSGYRGIEVLRPRAFLERYLAR
jgi:predicted nucleic acid-binding protein